MKKTFINILKFLGFFGVGATILFLLFRSLNTAYQAQCELDGIPADECSLLQKLITDFQEADPFWLGMVVFVYIMSNVSRAIRWKSLIKPLGYEIRFWNSFHTIMLGYFANLGLPRMGEVLRPVSLARYEKLPLEKVMGTLVTDRILDFLALFVTIGIAMIFEFDTLWGWLSENLNLAEKGQSIFGNPFIQAIIGLGVIVIAGIFIFRKKLIQSTLYKRVESIALGFWEGIISILKVDNLYAVAGHTIFIWLMYFSMTWFCMLSFAPTAHITPMQGLMVFVFGAIGMVMPSPGGMGTYHFMIMTALTLYGIDKPDGFSFANILFFVIQIFGNILLGLVALFALPIINRENVEGGN